MSYEILPVHSRRRQKTAEQSLRNYAGRLHRGGPETLGYKPVKKAPLWTDGHGRINNQSQEME